MKVRLRQSALASVLARAKQEVENFDREFKRAIADSIVSHMTRRPETLPRLVRLAGMSAAWKVAQELVTNIEDVYTKTKREPPDSLVELDLDFDGEPDLPGAELSLY